MKVKYKGGLSVVIPLLGITIEPGDVVDVDEDFNNDLFEPVEEIKDKKKKGENN